VLWLLGGVSQLTDEPRDARTELRAALAGPLTSLAIGLLWFADAAAGGGGQAMETVIALRMTVTTRPGRCWVIIAAIG
jgi:Zn-dependent protease